MYHLPAALGSAWFETLHVTTSKLSTAKVPNSKLLIVTPISHKGKLDLKTVGIDIPQ